MDEHVGVFNPIRKRGENFFFAFCPERRVCPVEKVFTKKSDRDGFCFPSLEEMATSITLTILRGQSLINRDSGFQGTSDPFVRVFLLSQKDPKKLLDTTSSPKPYYTTPVVSDSLNPVWKDAVLKWSGRLSSSSGFLLQVFDKDPIGSDFLGEARLLFSDMIVRESGNTTNVVSKSATLKLIARDNEPDSIVVANQDKLGTVDVSWTVQLPAHPTSRGGSATSSTGPGSVEKGAGSTIKAAPASPQKEEGSQQQQDSPSAATGPNVDHLSVQVTSACVFRACLLGAADASTSGIQLQQRMCQTIGKETGLPIVHLAGGKPEDGVPFHFCSSDPAGDGLTPLLSSAVRLGLVGGTSAVILWYRPPPTSADVAGASSDGFLSALISAALDVVGAKKGIRVSVEQYFANQVRDMLPKPAASAAAPPPPADSETSGPNEMSLKAPDRWLSLCSMARKRAALNTGHLVFTIRPDDPAAAAAEVTTQRPQIAFVEVASAEVIASASDAIVKATGAKMSAQEYSKYSTQQKYINTSVHSMFQALASIDALRSYEGKYWWNSCPFTKALQKLLQQILPKSLQERV